MDISDEVGALIAHSHLAEGSFLTLLQIADAGLIGDHRLGKFLQIFDAQIEKIEKRCRFLQEGFTAEESFGMGNLGCAGLAEVVCSYRRAENWSARLHRKHGEIINLRERQVACLSAELIADATMSGQDPKVRLDRYFEHLAFVDKLLQPIYDSFVIDSPSEYAYYEEFMNHFPVVFNSLDDERCDLFNFGWRDGNNGANAVALLYVKFRDLKERFEKAAAARPASDGN